MSECVYKTVCVYEGVYACVHAYVHACVQCHVSVIVASVCYVCVYVYIL